MKPYLLSLAVGLFVGGIYSLLGVRSPAPPAIALLGLMGMLLGEQAVPLVKRLVPRTPEAAFLTTSEQAGRTPDTDLGLGDRSKPGQPDGQG